MSGVGLLPGLFAPFPEPGMSSGRWEGVGVYGSRGVVWWGTSHIKFKLTDDRIEHTHIREHSGGRSDLVSKTRATQNMLRVWRVFVACGLCDGS